MTICVALDNMFRMLINPTKSNFRNIICLRVYFSSEANKEVLDPSNQICKILMSCPKLGVATALDQSGLRPSPETVEEVLGRFRNAGMLAYQFFEWAGKQHHYQHSVRAYHAVIDSLAKIRQYEIMWDLINTMRTNNLLNIETFCIIMRKYSRAQKVEEAIYTFNVMEKYNVTPNLAAFNGLLSALCKSKNIRKAQEIFNTMRDRFIPDQKTYSILIEGWGREPNLPKAREIYREMINDRCQPDIVTYGIMVDILCKAGRVDEERKETDEAFKVFRRMIKVCDPDADTYTIMIKMFSESGDIEMAFKVWKFMKRKQFVPSLHTFSVLINGLCENEDASQACMLMEEMIEKGIRPPRLTFGRLRKLLIQQKRDDVLEFLQQKLDLLVKEPLCD
ncbi:putative tetratricopeptide-like helical domain superfamily [Helianthus annuus]|nr:putative tetratricopeptide-like helical domain superfamily [Helianthus annuus]